MEAPPCDLALLDVNLPGESGFERCRKLRMQSDVPVIFLTETCAQQVPETLERYKTDPKCAVIPIPGSSGANGFGLSRVKANVEKAIGADILFNNEKEGT